MAKSVQSQLLKVLQQEDINFLLTNRIPRRLATRWMGWFSRIESPALARAAIAFWRLFADLDLTESKKTSFGSLRDCFTRELRAGARPLDGDFHKALQRYGYAPPLAVPPKEIVKAFQRHFRADRVDGMIDPETRSRLAGLLDPLGRAA